MSEQLHAMAGGYRTTQALYTVAKLGVADLLADGPKDADALARQVGVQPRGLFRVMRLLASDGVFTQDAADRFGLAPLGEPLRTDHPESVRYSLIMHGELHYHAAGELLHSVRTGEPGFDHLYGSGLFDYLTDHPDDSTTFNLAMSNSHVLRATPLAAYDLSSRHVVVDVGGGRGTVMAALLRHNPRLHGILFDLPQGVAQSRAYLESQGVADRCEIRTGNMFEAIPDGVDVVLFSRVLHDWPEEKGRQLLVNARRAIADDGLLLLLEAVVPPGSTPSPTKAIDVAMLFLLGGLERTEADWRAILKETGFAVEKITKTGGMFDLIEARAV